VEISLDRQNWTSIWSRCGKLDEFRRELVSLDEYDGQSIYLRFRLTDQSSNVELTDPGWTIDNICVITGVSTAAEDAYLPELPKVVLQQNYPNPFNPQTTIRYTLTEPAEVSLAVYNLKGQLVRELEAGAKTAGEHSAVWNGLDQSGKPVGSGIYLYRLESGDYNKTLKMILMK